MHLLTAITEYFSVVLPRITALWSASDWITNIFVLVLTAVMLATSLFYVTRMRFWDTAAGLSVAGLLFMMSATLILVTLGIWFDREYWGRDIIRPVVWGLAGVCAFAVGLTMARAYREAGRFQADIRARKLEQGES